MIRNIIIEETHMPAEKYSVLLEFTKKIRRHRKGRSAWGDRKEGVASRHAGCLGNRWCH